MSQTKNITVQIPENLLDKLSDAAKEYSVDSERLIVVAIQKLLNDIEFIRNLRSGKLDML